MKTGTTPRYESEIGSSLHRSFQPISQLGEPVDKERRSLDTAKRQGRSFEVLSLNVKLEQAPHVAVDGYVVLAILQVKRKH